jgi:hypothetical protein
LIITPEAISRFASGEAELFLRCGIWQHRFDLAANNGRAAMATQIIMDLNGDTRHNFDAKDVKALLEAERRFKALTGAGFTAATRTASGEPVVTRTFDPTVEETLFFPRLVGG